MPYTFHEGVIGVQQIQHTAIFILDALEKELRLAAERLAQVVVEVGKQFGVGSGGAQVAEIQPLLGKVVDEGARPRIGQHATDLVFENAG
jgi:hypothetical protein